MASVYISYSQKNAEFVNRLYADLAKNGVDVWVDRFNIQAGEEWESQILKALKDASTLIFVATIENMESHFARIEVNYALSTNKRIIPIVLSGDPAEVIPSGLRNLQYIDFRHKYKIAFQRLVGATKTLWNPESAEEPPQETEARPATTIPEPANKGYVFISYISDDMDFVQELKQFLKKRGYAYWDYRESERDYHMELYRELETKIEEAAAFLCILSDDWRHTLWTAREYIYAEESQVPVFIIEAKPRQRPTPIVLNLQPRIDMVADFQQGLKILGHELDKKGL